MRSLYITYAGKQLRALYRECGVEHASLTYPYSKSGPVGVSLVRLFDGDQDITHQISYPDRSKIERLIIQER